MSVMLSTDDAHLPPGLVLAWGLPAKSNKLGRKPTQSVEQIVEAALELADADGFAALSMPKIAQKLGLTANAIYRYVRSRDELLVLLADAAWGPAPDVDAKDWRSAATAWTQAMVDRCDVHPWLCDLPIRGAPMTPNLLGWAEAILKVLTGARLSPSESLSCALLLDGYARRIASARRDVRDSATTDVQPAAVARFLQPRLNELGYSTLAALMAGGQYSDEIHEADVSFGLDRILDGIDVLIAQKA
ncbi:TetR family transcriptional regulator [Kribbella voronezhensis]|uniref:TetR family transcriptional regulator n=1 Tax=Kribbella voronezhensis TaxID=2512212 RepID=A0A4R7T6V4_9ACTN|nr:helix-turn-helix domain-containing protein [Kribbella voronezhensis]TDU86828.1 TetR family transcriptional regulator [Kribbella voronezhensis]